MATKRHQIVVTSYGEVMVKENPVFGDLDCFTGDNWDNYIGEIEGSVNDDSAELKAKIERELF